MALFLECVFIFQWGVFFYYNQCQNHENNFFLDLMQFPRLAPPKTGQNWQNLENSDYLYIMVISILCFYLTFKMLVLKSSEKQVVSKKNIKNPLL